MSSSTSSCSLREVLSKTNTWRVSCSVLDLNVQKMSESLPGKGKGVGGGGGAQDTRRV